MIAYNYFLVLLASFTLKHHDFIGINLILALLLPHHLGETSVGVSHLIDQRGRRGNGGREGDGAVGGGDAGRGGRVLRAVPAGSEPPVPEGVHVGVHDLRGPDAEDDEPLHAAGPHALGTFFPILKGRRPRPEHLVPHAVHALPHR